jgi:pyruvate,water dikinase
MERMVKVGIDGVMINLDDLSQLMLGVDFSYEELMREGLKSKAAVVWMVKKMIKKAHKLGLSVGVMSERFLGELDMVEELIEAGVGRIVVSSKLVDRLRESVYLLEGQVVRKVKK